MIQYTLYIIQYHCNTILHLSRPGLVACRELAYNTMQYPMQYHRITLYNNIWYNIQYLCNTMQYHPAFEQARVGCLWGVGGAGCHWSITLHVPYWTILTPLPPLTSPQIFCMQIIFEERVGGQLWCLSLIHQTPRSLLDHSTPYATFFERFPISGTGLAWLGLDLWAELYQEHFKQLYHLKISSSTKLLLHFENNSSCSPDTDLLKSDIHQKYGSTFGLCWFDPIESKVLSFAILCVCPRGFAQERGEFNQKPFPHPVTIPCPNRLPLLPFRQATKHNKYQSLVQIPSSKRFCKYYIDACLTNTHADP